MIRNYFILAFLFCHLFSCKTQKVITKNEEPVVVSVESTVKEKEQSFNLPQVLPQAIVYKTVKAYNHLIPVTMDAERTKIVSYPAPSDVFYKGKLALPTVLQDGYLLDNRGIDENTVFLNYTYDEYSRLQEAPPMSEMMNKIRDKHPLAEIIFCGDRTKYKDEVKELNELIKNGFPNCRRVVLMSTSIQLSM